MQAEHPIGKDDPEWATMKMVRINMKKTDKGIFKYTKGIQYNAASVIVDNDPALQKMTKRARQEAKNRQSKEMAKALLDAIKSGSLFKAFCQAGRRFSVSEAMGKKFEEAFKVFQADPDNPEKLKALEEIELEMAKASDYTTAGGDVAILKELDHHNDLYVDAGLTIWDICKRGVANKTIQPLIQTIEPLHTTD